MDLKFLFILICSPMILLGQDLDALKWKKRVIVVYASTVDSKLAKEQMRLLRSETAQLEDYKLCILFAPIRMTTWTVIPKR